MRKSVLKIELGINRVPWCLRFCKESACNEGDRGSIPGSGRSPGEGNGYPLQYSCLRNPTDRGAWQAIVHGVWVGHDWVTNTHTNDVKYQHCRKIQVESIDTEYIWSTTVKITWCWEISQRNMIIKGARIGCIIRTLWGSFTCQVLEVRIRNSINYRVKIAVLMLLL